MLLLASAPPQPRVRAVNSPLRYRPIRRALDEDGTGEGMGGGSIPSQTSATASPRRMVPPLTTEVVNADVYCIVLSSRAEDS